MATLADRLNTYEGQPEQKWNKRKSISVEEKGQKYHLFFQRECESAVYAIDGGIITDETTRKCDKLILIELDSQKWIEFFIELKGRDIKHAIEQVEATLRNKLFHDSNVNQREARIIGRNIPRNTGSSITEISKKKFLSKYNCRLEFKTGPAKEKIII